MANKYGDSRHEEHMFSLHGMADTSKFAVRSGMEMGIERVLMQNGAKPQEAAETATAVFKGLQRYKDNPPEKQADFVGMMLSPFFKDKDAGFTAKPDAAKLGAAVTAVMEMAAKNFGPKEAAPAAPTGGVTGGQSYNPARPKTF